MGPVILASVFFLIGCAMVMTMGKPMLQLLRSRRWEQTSGIVVSAGTTVVPDLVPDGLNMPLAAPSVLYAYICGEKRLTGTRVGFFGTLHHAYHPGKPRYSEGERVVVWYDPENPEEAVLERRLTFGGVLWGIVAVSWFAVSGYVLLSLLAGRWLLE